MFLGSKDHFALRCLKAGLSVKQIVLLSYLATIVLGGIALGIMYASPVTTFWILFGIGVVILWIAWKLSQIQMPSNKEVFGEER